MVIADGQAIIVGRVLGKRLPEKPIRYGAALIFLASCVFTLVQAFRHQ